MSRAQFPLTSQIALMASSLQFSGVFSGPEKLALMQEVLRGIHKYHNFSRPQVAMPLHTLWHAGKAKIFAPAQMISGKPTLLLVPSMVNRAGIMDLMPERSLLRWLSAQGINACLLDWGEPTQDEGQKDVESVITKRLTPAIEHMAQQVDGPVCVLGYCMGGTLLAGAAAHAAHNIKSLIFLAAPWDFHAGAQELLARVRLFAPQAAPRMRESGTLPMDWIQNVFASLRPEAAIRKFVDFAKMDAASDAAKIFVAVEDWLNDGVDLPAETARVPIEQWFLANTPARGQWYVQGKPVHPQDLDLPTLVIASRQDKLVDYESAVVLHESIKGSCIIDAGCGHVGMMAGRSAVEKIWQPIADWVLRHN